MKYELRNRERKRSLRKRQQKKKILYAEKYEFLRKDEIIDVIALALFPIFAITLLYQVTFVQSREADLYSIGIFSLAQAIIVFIAICLFILAYLTGIVDVKNFTRGEATDLSGTKPKKEGLFSVKDIVRMDETFTDDYTQWFMYGLLIQVGFSLVYGGFAGSLFELDFSWNYNALIMVINSAVAEELFFSLFLTAFLLSLSKKTYHVVIACAINIMVFILFHSIVYGANMDAILYIVFLRGLYFALYSKTRRVSIPILLHIINNFIFVSTILFI